MAKPSTCRYDYLGLTGPFRVVDQNGHVVCIVHGFSNDANKDIPLVAAITRLCERHAKALAKEPRHD